MRIQIKRNFPFIKELGFHLWQIFEVDRVVIKLYNPRSTPNECKFYYAKTGHKPYGTTLFDFTEVKEI